MYIFIYIYIHIHIQIYICVCVCVCVCVTRICVLHAGCCWRRRSLEPQNYDCSYQRCPVRLSDMNLLTTMVILIIIIIKVHGKACILCFVQVALWQHLVVALIMTVIIIVIVLVVNRKTCVLWLCRVW